MSSDKQSRDSAASAETAWGRVAEDGTVYVRTADGERSLLIIRDVSREMHHCIGLMLDQQAADGVPIVDGRPGERHPLRQRGLVPGRQVVEHGDRVAGFDQGAHRVAADVTRAARHDNACHLNVRSTRK